MISIVFEFFRDFAVREALHDIPERETFIMSVNLRAVYFSLFIFYAFAFISITHPELRRNLLDKEYIKSTLRTNLKKMGVLTITPITFVCDFSLRTAAYGRNLAMSPLLSTASKILAIPALGAWYFTDGSEPHFYQRLQQVLGRIEPNQFINRIILSTYLISLGLCIVWLLYWYLMLSKTLQTI